MLVAALDSVATLRQMPKIKNLEEWQVQDAERLAALFKEKAPLSQAEFGAEFGIGSQGMVWQYLHAHRPLNIDAASRFAKGLNIKIDWFSPTIAKQISDAWLLTEAADASGRAPSAPWPFEGISAVRYSALHERLKGRIEERITTMIEESEVASAAKSKSRKNAA